MHRHKLHETAHLAQGPLEVRMICEQFQDQIIELGKATETVENEEDVCKPMPTHSEAPHMTWDDHFSGDGVTQSTCEKEFGLTMTCHHDWPPKGIPSACSQKERMPVNKRSKAARFKNPVFVTKD